MSQNSIWHQRTVFSVSAWPACRSQCIFTLCTVNGWHVLRPSYWEPAHCSDTRLQRQFCIRAGLTLHECTRITVKEKQQCRVQVGEKDAGACSHSGPCCWGWQHGQEASCPAPLEEVCSVMATPWLDKGEALAVLDDLSVLLLDCTRLY